MFLRDAAFAAMKANCFLSSMSKNIASRKRDVIIPLWLALVWIQLEHCVQFWFAHNPNFCSEKIESRVQPPTKVVKGLQNLIYEGRWKTFLQ